MTRPEILFDMAMKATLSQDAREKAILPLVYLGDPILETPCELIETFDSDSNSYLVNIATRIELTRERYRGAGLAAPQVGYPIRLAVINCENLRTVLCNPRITESSGEQLGWEGCLSIPGYELQRKRPMQVTVEFQDVTGERHSLTVAGFLARTIQHEVDHLDGKLFIDGFSRNVRRAAQRAVDKYRKLQGHS